MSDPDHSVTAPDHRPPAAPVVTHSDLGPLPTSVGVPIQERIATLIEKDPHLFGTRPCATCRNVSDLLGRPFGCDRIRSVVAEYGKSMSEAVSEIAADVKKRGRLAQQARQGVLGRLAEATRQTRPREDDKKVAPAEFAKMKAWFGRGEFDVDLLLRWGVLSEPQLVRLCEALTDSPWYQGAT